MNYIYKFVYLYRWHADKKEITIRRGWLYYHNSLYRSYLYADMDDRGKHNNFICQAGPTEGKYYNNSVWFTKPNPEGAKAIFSMHEQEIIDSLEESLAKRRMAVCDIDSAPIRELEV